MIERMYTLKITNEKTGLVIILDRLDPMTHSQACALKSKMTNYAWRRVELVQL